MTEYVPVIWMDHASGTVEGTQINKERLDQMQTQYKLTSSSRTGITEPSDPREGDWYFDTSVNSFRIFSNGWKNIIWAGSPLVQNKPLKWNGSEIASSDVSMDDVTGLGSALNGKADASVIAGKVDKVTGKVLSSNDYTNADKAKLAGIKENANAYVLPQAAASTRGGIVANPKGSTETREVKIDTATGKLYSAPVILDSSWPSVTTNNNAPSTKLVKDSLDGKADLSDKKVNGPQNVPLVSSTDQGTAMLNGVGSTMTLRILNSNLGAPFSEIPGTQTCSMRLTYIDSNLIKAEASTVNPSTGDSLNATAYKVAGTWGQWTRPKGWKTIWQGHANHNATIPIVIEEGTRYKITVRADNSIHESMGTYLSSNWGGALPFLIGGTFAHEHLVHGMVFLCNYGLAIYQSTGVVKSWCKRMQTTSDQASGKLFEPVNFSNHAVLKVEKEIYT